MNTNYNTIAQQGQLQIMDRIHKVCMENGLRYYLIGGSALGAIRHRGFIPWDVDIDIAMPRSDYEEFLKLANEKLGERYVCHHCGNQKRYTPPHARVHLQRSELRYAHTLLNPSPSHPGLYVDILPLDYVSESIEAQNRHACQLRLIRRLRDYKEAKIYEDSTFLTIIAKNIIRMLMGIIPWTIINKKQQDIAKRFNNLKSPHLYCSTMSHYEYHKLVVPVRVYGTPTLYDFEGRQYCGPQYIDEYLKNLFGDYMKFPSKEVQNASANMIKYAHFE